LNPETSGSPCVVLTTALRHIYSSAAAAMAAAAATSIAAALHCDTVWPHPRFLWLSNTFLTALRSARQHGAAGFSEPGAGASISAAAGRKIPAPRRLRSLGLRRHPGERTTCACSCRRMQGVAVMLATHHAASKAQHSMHRDWTCDGFRTSIRARDLAGPSPATLRCVAQRPNGSHEVACWLQMQWHLCLL